MKTEELTMIRISGADFRIGDRIEDIWSDMYEISRIEPNNITLRRMETQDDSLIMTDDELSMTKDGFDCAFNDEIERRKRWWLK